MAMARIAKEIVEGFRALGIRAQAERPQGARACPAFPAWAA
jgi:hypothetical protein